MPISHGEINAIVPKQWISFSNYSQDQPGHAKPTVSGTLDTVKREWILTLIILLSLGLAACAQNTGSASAMGATPSPEITATPEPTATLPPPTNTPKPTASPSALPPSPLPDDLPPTDPPPPTISPCLLRGGQIKRDFQTTSLLPQPLQYRLYLPPCYDENPERRYPVLYLIHGQTYTDDQWDRLGVDEAANVLIAIGELPSFIVVMPRDRVWTQPSENNFGRAFIELLIPAIDAEFRTLPDRQYRAIGGLSRGAAWAVHIGLQHPELFSAIGAHSLPVFWEDTPFVSRWLDAISLENMPRLYLDIGIDDRPEVMKSALWFEDILVSKNIPHEWHLFQGTHDENYWRSHVEQYLTWYAKEW